jgi:hypothetical protein
METKDWVGVYGALLSTSLALREIWKHRRATRPKLVGYVRTGVRADGAVIEQRTPLGDDKGEARAIIVQNRGGTATSIQAYHLFIPSRWVPRVLLGVLGELGRLPSAYAGPEGFSMRPRDPEIVVQPSADAELRVMLWTAHREALERGRLMVQISHSWSRVRAQQIRVHRAL